MLRFLSLSALLLLSGCFHHCYRSRPFCLEQTDLKQNVAHGYASDAVAQGEIYSKAWWHFFKDPQLDRLIALSLACHPDIKMADARIRLAYEEAKIARSRLFPHLFGVVDIKRQKVSTTAPGFVPGFPDLFTDVTLKLTTAVYELDIWQKNRSLYYAACDVAKAAVANFEEAKLLLSTTIAAVYFDLQMQLARKLVTYNRLKAKEELLELNRQQFDSGVHSAFALYEVGIEVQALKDLLFRLDAEIAIDTHALAALASNTSGICANEGELLITPNAHFDDPFPLPMSLPIDLIARRPDITAQKWLIEAACYDVKAARASFFPRIDLLGWLGTESIKLNELFTGKTLIALAEGTATLPIFLAGKLKADLGVAHETLEIAIDTYNQTLLRAVEQVSNGLSNLITADERTKAINIAVQDANHLVDLTIQKYENAVFNRLEVLRAFENLYIQQDLMLQAQLARYESAVELIRAIGGGYREL